MEVVMSTCPGCGTDVRPLLPSCRSCGALLMAPPAPMASVASAGVTNGGSGPSPDEQVFAPAVLQPIVQLPPRTSPPARRSGGRGPGVGGDAGKWISLAAMLLFFV